MRRVRNKFPFLFGRVRCPIIDMVRRSTPDQAVELRRDTQSARVCLHNGADGLYIPTHHYYLGK